MTTHTSTPDLDGSFALVTGGGSGIGLACASRLHRDGATVTLAGRSAGKLASAAAQLGSERVRTAVCDVTDENAVRSAVVDAAGPDGSLDVVVCSAGGGMLSPLVRVDLDVWRAVLDTNLTGTFLTIKHAAPAMAASGGGAIVVISSIASPLTHRYMAPYSVSKAGVDMLVRCAADELGADGIRVNAVQPSLVRTDLTGPVMDASPEIVADYVAQMPLGRLGTVEDVAEAVRFLVGPESRWVTGQCLGVDGGHALRRGPDYTPLVRLILGEDVSSRGPGAAG
jgi:NAD(P)-dependent dehydrogenase (short-subunit alcohol dehydrogenase family)